MLPDRVSNPGPLTYESGALPIALRGPELLNWNHKTMKSCYKSLLNNLLVSSEKIPYSFCKPQKLRSACAFVSYI